jgi:methylphosphotriester-DNA--protein-cysteine methyltransferase
MLKHFSALACLTLILAACGYSASTTATTAAQQKPAVKFVGSSKSNVYHLLSCRSAQRINSDNLLTFDSREDAVKAGYRACLVCKP